MPLPQVQSKAGKMYDADSPQGRTIIAAKSSAAAAAAQSTGFSGSAMSAGFIVLDKQLEDIKTNVISINENVNTIVQLAQSDARGDALRAADVPHDVQETAELAGMGGGAGDGAGGGGDDMGLGGLMGIGASIGSFGKGLSFWGTPLAIAGGVAFLAFLGGLILIGKLGAVVFRDSVDDIVEGMETLSDADVDTEKVILMGEALSKFGLAMAAEGLGKGLQGLGTLVGGIADGLAGFLGIEGKDPMVALKEFSKHEISEDEVKQIELNARALTVFSGAMTVAKIGEGMQSITELVTGVADGLRSLIPVEKRDPMKEMWAFSEWKFDQARVDQIKLNAAALLGFQTAMVVVKAEVAVESIFDLITGVADGLRALIPVDKRDPMQEMWDFAQWEFTEKHAEQIGRNAKSLLAFSGAMAGAESLGTVESVAELFGGIARGITSFFGLEDDRDPMADMKKFAEKEITEEEAKRIGTNAKALVEFSKAMALYKASGALSDSLNLVSNMATGIVDFFGGTKGIDYEEIKTFAASDIGTLEPKITANATALSTFAAAMKGMAGDKIDVEWKNIGANILGAIGGFFGGTAEENLMKNFTAIEEFTATELDLDTVDNNIQAINKFMEFGQSWIGFKGGDFKAVGDFAEALVISANGIHTAMYGGKYVKPGLEWNITIPDGEGLAAVELGHMTEASKGIAVLRHSLIAQEPLQALQSATAAMSASTGDVTIINANDNSSSSRTDNTIVDMSVEHDEESQKSLLSKILDMI